MTVLPLIAGVQDIALCLSFGPEGGIGPTSICNPQRYSYAMNIAAIVAEIDSEIEKLRTIRHIIQGLSAPAHSVRRKPKRSTSSQLPEINHVEPQIEVLVQNEVLPQIKVVPPRQKREYRPRTRPSPQIPKALARAPLTGPVFVPRSAVPNTKLILTTPRLSHDALEAVVRQNLMGGVA